MMNHVAELLVRTANLAEAEGRELRRAVGRLGIGLSFSLVAGTFLLMGGVMLLTAVWLALHESVGRPGASCITGIVALGLGWGALRLAEKYHS